MGITIRAGKFEWDYEKQQENMLKHGLHFVEALEAFSDPYRLIARDEKHSFLEERWICLGYVRDKVATVRFVFRGEIIRVIGAGFWRKGRERYEEKNKTKN